MFEDDRAPVTLSEIYSQSASCQRTVELAGKRRRSLDQFIPLDARLICSVTSAALGCAVARHLGAPKVLLNV